jgi:predicted RNA binding protein YcfA (HicA-like mRNA interferase family)
MDKCDKLLEKARRSPNNLRFTELCQLAECYGFTLQRQHGSHHIYKRPGYPLALTFPECTGKVKAAYVRLLLDAIEELELGGSDEE